MAEKGSIRILCFGAHPDDCDINAGGFALKHIKIDNKVKFISLTNGDAGHHEVGGASLAQRRLQETNQVAQQTGIDYEVLGNHDGKLQPTLENRRKVVTRIRKFEPHLVLSPRPYDYHPDHRAASTLVQDSLYMVTVPNICPQIPHLNYNPVAAYLHDEFQKPYPFDPDFVVKVDDVIEGYFDMLQLHESQVYEWLPYNQGKLDQVPKEGAKRREWLIDEWGNKKKQITEGFRDEVTNKYGANGSQIDYVEPFELCEYGGNLTEDLQEKLFPF